MVAVMSELLEAPRRAIEGQESRRMKKRKAKVVEKKKGHVMRAQDLGTHHVIPAKNDRGHQVRFWPSATLLW
jgi:hypothetical protein